MLHRWTWLNAVKEERILHDTKLVKHFIVDSAKCFSTLTKNFLYLLNFIPGQFLFFVHVLFFLVALNVVLTRKLEHPIIDYITLEWENIASNEVKSIKMQFLATGALNCFVTCFLTLSFCLYCHHSLVWTSILRCPLVTYVVWVSRLFIKNQSLSYRLVCLRLTFGQQAPLRPC